MTYWGGTQITAESSEGFVFKDLALSPPRQRCREEKGEGSERERKKKNCEGGFDASCEVSNCKVLGCGDIE